MLCANVCAGIIRLCYGVGGSERVLVILGAPGDSVCGRCWLCWSTRSCVQDSGYEGVPIAVGHYLRGPLGVHWFLHQDAWKIRESSSYYVGVLVYLLALVRLCTVHRAPVSWSG